MNYSHLEEIIEPQLDEQLHQQILDEMFDRWILDVIASLLPQVQIEI
jgi:hypothetical protein